MLLIAALGLSLSFTALAKVTDEKRGPKVAALVVGTGFIRGNSVDTEEARQSLTEHGGVIHPLPNVPSIAITEADLKSTPAEISIKVFKPITDSIYHDGIEATANKYASTPEQREKFKKDASLLAVFTRQTHQTLNKLATVFLVFSLVLAVGLAYFSAGWGRMANLGLLLLLVSLPGSLLSLILLHPPKDGSGGLGSVSPALTTEIGQAVSQSYVKVTICGLLLLAVALLGKIFSHFHRSKDKPAAKPT